MKKVLSTFTITFCLLLGAWALLEGNFYSGFVLVLLSVVLVLIRLYKPLFVSPRNTFQNKNEHYFHIRFRNEKYVWSVFLKFKTEPNRTLFPITEVLKWAVKEGHIKEEDYKYAEYFLPITKKKYLKIYKNLLS